MAKLIERTAECEQFFKDNWIETGIYIEDDSQLLDTNGLEKYIKIAYINTDNKLAGMGRKTGAGVYQVSCYHKIKKLSANQLALINSYFNKEVELLNYFGYSIIN